MWEQICTTLSCCGLERFGLRLKYFDTWIEIAVCYHLAWGLIVHGWQFIAVCYQLAWGPRRRRPGCGRVRQLSSGLGEAQGAPNTWLIEVNRKQVMWFVVCISTTACCLLACGSSPPAGLGLLWWPGPPGHPPPCPSRLLSGGQHIFGLISRTSEM